MYIFYVYNCFSDGASESDLQDFLTELTILKEINKIPHPNVIKFLGGCTIDGTIFRKLCFYVICCVCWVGITEPLSVSFTIIYKKCELWRGRISRSLFVGDRLIDAPFVQAANKPHTYGLNF